MALSGIFLFSCSGVVLYRYLFLRLDCPAFCRSTFTVQHKTFAVSASEWPQTHELDRAATGISRNRTRDFPACSAVAEPTAPPVLLEFQLVSRIDWLASRSWQYFILFKNVQVKCFYVLYKDQFLPHREHWVLFNPSVPALVRRLVVNVFMGVILKLKPFVLGSSCNLKYILLERVT